MAGGESGQLPWRTPLRYGSTVVVMAVDTTISRGYEEPYIQYMGDHGPEPPSNWHSKSHGPSFALGFKLLRLAAIGYSSSLRIREAMGSFFLPLHRYPIKNVIPFCPLLAPSP